jgi:hypothetical protein
MTKGATTKGQMAAHQMTTYQMVKCQLSICQTTRYKMANCLIKTFRMAKCLVAICLATSCEMLTCQIGHMATGLMTFDLCKMQISTDHLTTEFNKGKCNKQFTIVTYSCCRISYAMCCISAILQRNFTILN